MIVRHLLSLMYTELYANKYSDIILSLTRTSRVGYLRDIRRLTVALSRARLGLYIVGRREIFESCLELREAFELLLKRPDKLALVTGELWPVERILGEDPDKEVPGEAVMESVEHIGQYVFEMTNTKIKQLREERGLSGDVPVIKALEQALGDEVRVVVDDDESGEDDNPDETVRAEGFEAEED